MRSLRHMIVAALAVALVTVMLPLGASAGAPAGPTATGAQKPTPPSQQRMRCPVGIRIAVIQSRERVVRIKGSITFNTKQVSKYSKAKRNAKSTKARKRAAKKLKTAKTALKESKAALPSALTRFNSDNQRAIQRGCAPATTP